MKILDILRTKEERQRSTEEAQRREAWARYRAYLEAEIAGKLKPDDADGLAEVVEVLGLDERTIRQHADHLQSLAQYDHDPDELAAAETELEEAREASIALGEEYARGLKPRIEAASDRVETALRRFNQLTRCRETFVRAKEQFPELHGLAQ